MDENSSFVFGLLAVQLKGLEPRQLIRACGGFPPESVSSLGSSLVERGLLDESDRCLLERLTEEIIAAHDGDSSAALVFWGGRQQISALFGSSLTPSALNEAVTLPLSGLPLAPDELDIVSEETPDRYTQITQYARGGMGRIFVVHDKLMARNVALKELLAPPEDGAQSPSQPRVGLVGRFLQEARLTGQLEHPAIVPVYELGRRINGAFYYTMKLVRGKTLLEALHARTQLVERLELLPHFLDLCQAIAYAHSRRIIHRDIKPANVMIGEFGETVVLDWGLAKAYGSPDVHAEEILQASASGQSASRTAYGKALGTPHYMPPEQAEGRIDAVDERSDVYSLGAVLYEILTGRPPFEGNTTQETIDRLLSEDLALVGTVEPAAPPELAGICQKALRKDPAQRYSSARELADEIIRYQSGALVQAYTYSFGRLLSRFYDRHRSAVRTAMAGVLAFLVLASYANVRLLQASQHEHAQRVAAEDAHRLAVEAQNHENEARHLAEQKAYSSQILLAQANILNENYAYANETLWQTQESRRGWEWGFLLNECNRDVLTIQATQYTPSRLIMEISPDDRFVFLMADTGPIKAWDLTTGSCVLTIDEKASANMDMAVGADQHRIVTAARDRPVTVWDTRTGLKTASFDQHMLVRRCAISGDGALAATVASNGSLQVWNCATGEEVAAMKVGMPARSMHFLDNDRLIVELIHDEVAVWEWSTGKRLVRVRGNLQAISADGRFFATAQGTSGGVWNAASGTRTCTLTDHTSDIVSLSFNSDGTRIITTTVDGTVQVSQVATGEPLLSFGSSRPLTDIVLSPSGKYVLGVSGKRVWIWDGETVKSWPRCRDIPATYSMCISILMRRAS